ncbi:MAG: DUF2089 domain-containing protein [Propionicimonas sp.]|jgi:hypothetical protein
MTQPQYRAPSDCPVCGGDLITTRVGCRGCGTELVGEFAHCDFCGLDERETEVLRIFLASRGNLREIEKHLGVSYPTARARFTELLTKLGLNGETAPAAMTREQVLSEVASGALTPAEAATLLAGLD